MYDRKTTFPDGDDSFWLEYWLCLGWKIGAPILFGICRSPMSK
jgi:hypothetical protein